jgi:uroporphyrinogen-III synthase
VLITLTVPEPNTWREILQFPDQNAGTIPLKNARVAVQKHGVPSRELYAGLAERGAQVFPVPVYKWAPPENTEPLRAAIRGLALGNFDVALFTSSVQVHHLFRFADEMGSTPMSSTDCGVRSWDRSARSRRRLCANMESRRTWSHPIRKWASW